MAQKRKQTASGASMERLIANAPCGIGTFRFVAQRSLRVLYFNRALFALSGYDADDIDRFFDGDALQLVLEEDRAALCAELVAALAESRMADYVCRVLRRDGQISWIRFSAVRAQYEGGDPVFDAQFMNITEERTLQESLKERTEHESLTGLLNRIGFERRITAHLQTCGEKPSAFIIIDIDNFKQVNDTFGHTVGDELLQSIARTLEMTFAPNGISARFGGDEFAAYVFDATDGEKLSDAMTQFCTCTNEAVAVGERKLCLSASAGVALSPQRGTSFQELYSNADKALLFAKGHGKHQFRVSSKDMEHFRPLQVHNMEWLLDETANAIYVCNADTYELLYLNRNGCKMAGLEHQPYQDEKCYSSLMHLPSPCPFCKMDGMSTCEFLEREFCHPQTGDSMLLKGKIIDWNGIRAHVEFITDNTRHANLTQELCQLKQCLAQYGPEKSEL